MDLFNRSKPDRDQGAGNLAHAGRGGEAAPLCSRCGLTEDTGLCPGCQKYFCADCTEPHFAANGPEYCPGLRIGPARAENGQLVDPLLMLLGTKIFEDQIALGRVEVAGVDSKGRRLYRKL
jgi:hypothetical protein